MTRSARRRGIIIVLVLLLIVVGAWRLTNATPSFTLIATQIAWDSSGKLGITVSPPAGREIDNKQAILTAFVPNTARSLGTQMAIDEVLSSLINYPFMIAGTTTTGMLFVGSLPGSLPALPTTIIVGRGSLKIKG